jgi:hypothetical protein
LQFESFSMPPAGALRVVGRDQTYAQFGPQTGPQLQYATRGIPGTPPLGADAQTASGLAGFILDQFTLMRRHRDDTASGWSARLLRALRAFNGVYEQEIIEEIKKFGGSSVYARIIAQKCRGTTSLLRDVYIGVDRPWALEPPSDPAVPPEIVNAIEQLMQNEVQAAIQAHQAAKQRNLAHMHGVMAAHAFGAQTGQTVDQVHGELPPPPQPPPPLPDASAIRDRYRSLLEGARDAAKRNANEQSRVAEDKLEQLLAEGGFYTALAEFLVDLPLFPYAVIKGPTVRIKSQVRWTGNRASAIDVPMLTWSRVSPFDIYWTPGVSDIADANVVERTRLTRAEINDMLDLPGFITSEVRAVLDEYGRGGLVDNWDQTDSERAILENRENPRFNQSGLLACLEFQGTAQGQQLLDIGLSPTVVADPLRDYYINAWLIGRHIIKVQPSPSPRKRHQYYVTSFEKVPGTPVGNGLPDLLSDIQAVGNATLRALVNNLSIASGPQVVVNDDRLGDGENGEELYPWKRWHVKSDPFGNNTEQAITFFNPASNVAEMLQVYQSLTQMADEASAIPRFMTGSPPAGGLGRTASGLSMLMQNTSKILQTVAANVDRDVMQGILEHLMDMVLLTDNTGLLSGEEKVRVLGVQTAIQRETQRSRQIEFLQITANPIDAGIIGPHGRAEILRQVATTIGLPGEDIVPTDDQLKAQAEQAAQMAAVQGSPGHAIPGAPAQPPQAVGPTGQPGNQGPQGITQDMGPRTNLVNTNMGGGAPVAGGP